MMLFSNASHALSELIYSAWMEAGKPQLFTGPFILDPTYSAPKYLEPNVPNPFSSSTTVHFSLPSATRVSLKVRDTMGNTVDTLLLDVVLDGKQSMVWQPVNLANGLYLIILETDEVTEIRKMVLMN
jgi:hypothetical protein